MILQFSEYIMFSSLNFGGIIVEPQVDNENDLRIEFIKYITKKENIDIMNVVPNDILELCDLRIVKYYGSFEVDKFNDKLTTLLYKFFESNNFIMSRIPGFILNYVNKRYQTILRLRSENIVNYVTNVIDDNVKIKNDVIESTENNQNINSNKWKRNHVHSKNKISKEKRYKDTSENEKTNCIMLRNLKKYITTKDIRNLLLSYNLILNKHVNSIHFPIHHNKRDRMDYAFITFCNEFETNKAKKILNGLRWKNCSLGVLNARENN